MKNKLNRNWGHEYFHLRNNIRRASKRSGLRLIGSPGLIDGEALSGWIYRLCMQHRIRPGNLIGALGFAGPTSSLDFCPLTADDRWQIARATLTNPMDIDEASALDFTILGKRSFVCLSNDVRNRVPIYRLCPDCLAYDDIPHIRLMWRLAYNFICEHHRRPFLDTCGHCGHRLDFTFRFPRRTFPDCEYDIGHCNRCGNDLTGAAFAPVNSDLVDHVLQLQNEFHDRVRRSGLEPNCTLVSPAERVKPYLETANDYDEDAEPCFTGLSLKSLFGSEWKEIAKQIPCMR
ncbi:TniQ family protein [Paraburkholderia tagetis]|uniref:TniQ family protein n=1 Tax=Paraburkholderia tagetis TaxID=2913261 RepID=A0A9X1UNX6_9BURK|nr:TniQ family protein [Paraburkholderia tagetis]